MVAGEKVTCSQRDVRVYVHGKWTILRRCSRADKDDPDKKSPKCYVLAGRDDAFSKNKHKACESGFRAECTECERWDRARRVEAAEATINRTEIHDAAGVWVPVHSPVAVGPTAPSPGVQAPTHGTLLPPAQTAPTCTGRLLTHSYLVSRRQGDTTFASKHYKMLFALMGHVFRETYGIDPRKDVNGVSDYYTYEEDASIAAVAYDLLLKKLENAGESS